MTPDLLNKISSIVNKELIPQSLSEINEPENKQASAGATQSQSNQNFAPPLLKYFQNCLSTSTYLILFTEFEININSQGIKGYTYPNPMLLNVVR